MTRKTALITGASKGIGREFAKIHGANGDNLVLVARSGDELYSLKKELEAVKTIRVDVIVKDLTADNSALEVYNYVKENNIEIDYLINNAGLGEFGFFVL